MLSNLLKQYSKSFKISDQCHNVCYMFVKIRIYIDTFILIIMTIY